MKFLQSSAPPPGGSPELMATGKDDWVGISFEQERDKKRSAIPEISAISRKANHF